MGDDEREVEEARKEMQELEEGDPPEKLEDWPGGKAKYQTYGGPDSGEGGYEDHDDHEDDAADHREKFAPAPPT